MQCRDHSCAIKQVLLTNMIFPQTSWHNGHFHTCACNSQSLCHMFRALQLLTCFFPTDNRFPETDIMGPYIFGNGSSFIQELPLDQLNNRQRLIDFCKYHGYSIASTYFSEAPQKQCTFKFSPTEGFTSPWTPERFAQLDHILCAKRWGNCIIDVESRPDIAFDSDHAFLTATIRIELNQ